MTDSNGQCPKSADSFTLLCGKSPVEVKLPKPADIIDIQTDKPELSEAEIADCLENGAIYSYGLSEVIEDADKILIILPDATRKSGAERILPKIVADITAQGKEFHFIIAVGTHRAPTEEELVRIMTPEIYQAHKDRLISHDSDDYDRHDFYGITKRKTTVLINKAYREHDTIITIGSVSYHYFAGYGGGRKLIVPGIASKKTAMGNHKLALDAVLKKRHEKAVTGNLRGNPVHDDLVESVMIARATHTFFAVNTILDNNGKITEMTCGDLFMSHLKAAEKLDTMCAVEFPQKYDFALLSAGGYPKDINLVQAQKALDRVVPLLRDDAVVVFFAQCSDGYGNKFFEDFFDAGSSDSMLDVLLGDYQINRQTAYNLRCRLEKYQVYMYTDLSEEDCKRIGCRKLEDIGMIAKLAEKADNPCFIPHPHNIFIKS
jgi:nickel-dependent lactate racemase